MATTHLLYDVGNSDTSVLDIGISADRKAGRVKRQIIKRRRRIEMEDD